MADPRDVLGHISHCYRCCSFNRMLSNDEKIAGRALSFMPLSMVQVLSPLPLVSFERCVVKTKILAEKLYVKNTSNHRWNF